MILGSSDKQGNASVLYFMRYYINLTSCEELKCVLLRFLKTAVRLRRSRDVTGPNKYLKISHTVYMCKIIQSRERDQKKKPYSVFKT